MTQLKTRQAGALSRAKAEAPQKYIKTACTAIPSLYLISGLIKRRRTGPSVTFRNQSYTEDFAGKNSAAYIFVFTPGNIEFYRYNNGVRTVLCGNFPGLESMVGDVVSTDALKFNEKNTMSITTRNEGDGVRIILKINGEEVINLLDNFDGVIKIRVTSEQPHRSFPLSFCCRKE